jgi:hypothetical protein
MYYGPKIVTSGLVLCLDAANKRSYPGTGTTWTDLSGNSNNGTLINGPTFSAGNQGSIVFDGTDDYISIGSQNIVGTGTSPFSVELCIYNTKNWGVGEYTMLFRAQQDSEFFVTLYNPSGTLLSTPIFRGNYTMWSTPITPANFVNKWAFLNYVYNGGDKGTATSYVSYLNGVQLPTGTVNMGPANGGLASNCNIIGVDGDNGCNSINGGLLQGKISLYKLYNRVLSAGEVLQNYNAVKSRFGR